MLGAIIGDVVGSLNEFESTKEKDFELFTPDKHLTDDSFMTVAVGLACAESAKAGESQFKSSVVYWMQKIGRKYPNAGYGYHFYKWLRAKFPIPYGSFGNGSAMRVSPVAWVADTLEQAEELAKWSAEVSHNHPEGIKGAQAVASAIFLARMGKSKEEIKKYIEEKYYIIDFTLDEIRPEYSFDVTCQGSVPQALECFFESESFEDAIRNAVSLGGDCDTQGAIAGSIAEAYYGIPKEISNQAFEYFPSEIKKYFDAIVENIYK